MSHVCGYCSNCLALATKGTAESMESRGQVGVGACCNCGAWSANLYGAAAADTATKHHGHPPQYPGHRRSA